MAAAKDLFIDSFDNWIKISERCVSQFSRDQVDELTKSPKPQNMKMSYNLR